VALFNNEVPFSLAKLRVSAAVATSIRDLVQGRSDERDDVWTKVAILQRQLANVRAEMPTDPGKLIIAIRNRRSGEGKCRLPDSN
jgi:hypothetical protein